MTLLVDTSVWSLAFRRDAEQDAPQIRVLRDALASGEPLVTTGLILQELLQGFAGPRARKDLIERFSSLPLLIPDRADHINAAELRNLCRRSGIQIGTIDALLSQLCIRHSMTLLTTDNDFVLAAKYCDLDVWTPN
jgi:predicted nucleic acid-binding protein